MKIKLNGYFKNNIKIKKLFHKITEIEVFQKESKITGKRYFLSKGDEKIFYYTTVCNVPIKIKYQISYFQYEVKKEIKHFNIERKYIPGTEENLEYKKSLRPKDVAEDQDLLIWFMERYGFAVPNEIQHIAEKKQEYDGFSNHIGFGDERNLDLELESKTKTTNSAEFIAELEKLWWEAREKEVKKC